MKKVLLLFVLLVLGSPGLARADAVIDWNETAASAGFAAGLDNEAGCVDPLHESRIFAMMHAAIHDALNAIERRSQPYALDALAPAETSPEAAVAAAAHDVLVALFPQLPSELGLTPAAATDLVEAAYVAALEAIPDGPAKAQGILIGQAAAAAILALRDADGSGTPPSLILPTSQDPIREISSSSQGSRSLLFQDGEMSLPSCSPRARSTGRRRPMQ